MVLSTTSARHPFPKSAANGDFAETGPNGCARLPPPEAVGGPTFWCARLWTRRQQRTHKRATPKLPEFQCRVLGDDPLAVPPSPPTTPSNPAPRRPHQPPTRIQEVATAASRRRQRVGLIAGRSADQRCWVGAPRARESMDKEEERLPRAGLA
jgi:hypothetical protein